jgi:hypothetical protein
MSLPSPHVLSYDSKQVVIAVWNVFPIVTLVIVATFAAVAPKESRKQPESLSELSRRHITTVRWVYAPALVFSFCSHIAVSAVSASTRLFPTLFRPEYLADLNPSMVFVPPIAVVMGETVGDGTRSFMLWDQLIGYATIGLFMLVQLSNAFTVTGKSFSWPKAVVASLLCWAITGGGSTCLLISWMRDEALYGD